MGDCIGVGVCDSVQIAGAVLLLSQLRERGLVPSQSLGLGLRVAE